MSGRLARVALSPRRSRVDSLVGGSGIDLSGAETESQTAMFEVARSGESFASNPVPGGSAEVRKAICDHLKAERGCQADPHDEILMTEGATGAFRLIAEAFINRGDRVVVCEPGSPMHASILSYRGAKIEYVRSRVGPQGFQEINPCEFTTALHGARLLVLSQPNNPDGGLWTPAQIEEIQWWAAKRNFLVVLDETYAAYLPETHQTYLGDLPGWGERVITVGSLSKSHAASGARIGWVHGGPALIAAMETVLNAQEQGIPWPVEKAALRLFGSTGVAVATRRKIQDHRAWAERKLAGFGMRACPGNAGIFLWLPTWNLNPISQDLVETLWNDCRVRLAPGTRFGPWSEGHVRLNLAGDPGRFQEAMSRLESWSNHLGQDQTSPTEKSSVAWQPGNRMAA